MHASRLGVRKLGCMYHWDYARRFPGGYVEDWSKLQAFIMKLEEWEAKVQDKRFNIFEHLNMAFENEETVKMYICSPSRWTSSQTSQICVS